MMCARVVEARGDVDDELHLPTYREYSTDDAVPMRRPAGTRWRHEVLHLPDSLGHQEARDQDIGVGEVELLGAPGLARRRNAEQAPTVGVEDRPEDTRRVETRTAVPVDRPVGAYECDSVQVADQAVLGDREVPRPRRATTSARHDPIHPASTKILRHLATVLVRYGTRTSFPVAAELSSISCRAARFSERETLSHDRVDLVRTKQLDQHSEILPELIRVHRLPADCSVPPRRLVAVFLDGVGVHVPARRHLVPQPHGRDRGVPLEHRQPILVAVLDRAVAAEDDESAARPERPERAQRDRPTQTVDDNIHTAAVLTNARQEVLVLVIDRHRPQRLDLGAITRGRGAVQAKPSHRSQLESRNANSACRAVHERRLPRLHLGRAMKHLVRGHVRKQQAQDLPRIEILRNVHCTGLRHTHPLRVRAPDRQCANTVADPQPRAARAELFDNADKLVTGRERRFGSARKIRAGAQLGIGERHPRRQNLDHHLARPRSGIPLFDHLQDLGPTEMVNHDTLHRKPPLRCHSTRITPHAPPRPSPALGPFGPGRAHRTGLRARSRADLGGSAQRPCERSVRRSVRGWG